MSSASKTIFCIFDIVDAEYKLTNDKVRLYSIYSETPLLQNYPLQITYLLGVKRCGMSKRDNSGAFIFAESSSEFHFLRSLNMTTKSLVKNLFSCAGIVIL